MKSTDYVGTAVTFWKRAGLAVWSGVRATTRCIRSADFQAEPMMHEESCSLDLRNREGGDR
jgi:hypothetical protein